MTTFIRLLALAGICLLGMAGCKPAPPEPGVLILDNVHIVDPETGAASPQRSVLIINGIVEEIADSARGGWPSGLRPAVDGFYLAPALYDSHVHIFDERDLEMYALYGIQAVRNMDGWPWHLYLRNRSIDPEVPRARFLTAGSQLQAPEIASGEAALARVESEQAAGYDWVKIYDGLPAQALNALAAHTGTRVTGHLPTRVPLPEVLDSGVYDDIAHAEELAHAIGSAYPEGEAGLDALAADMNSAGVSLTTTIVNNQMIAEQVADIEANLAREVTADAPPLLQAFWSSNMNPWAGGHRPGSADGLARQVESLKALAAGLHRRGVTLLAGTDAPNPTTVPGASLHQELAILVDAGLTPAEALRSATVAPADHLEPGSQGGRVRVGAPAWFIVMKQNPLDDISRLERFDDLVLRGKWYSRSDLERLRANLRAEYARDLELLSALAPDSPEPVLAAMDRREAGGSLSAEGLTSLVWFYLKVGNPEAALAVADRLSMEFPTAESQAVADYVAGLVSPAEH